MPIRNSMEHHLPKSRLEKEEDVLELLRDIKIDLTRSNKDFQSTKLKNILTLVEGGKCIVPQEGVPNLEVDLSDAYAFISEYKDKSEGLGCRSCKDIRYLNFESDSKTGCYCDFYEKPDSVNQRTGFFPKLKKYFEKGCDERKLIFRPLEEVLKGIDF